MPPETVTRFAPSPTGHLHLGHAFAALIAAGEAVRAHGRFLVRIEDIDTARARPGFEDAIFEDLAWLGLEWETPVRRQSDHFADYQAALARLEDMGLLYPCFCTRKEIRAEIEAAGRAPHGPDGPLYPGTCRALPAKDRARRKSAGHAYALRLDTNKAMARAGELEWLEKDRGAVRAEPGKLGDVVLARKETPASYFLAATLDDHRQGVTLVTRGQDLFTATHLQRLLQALLDLETPDYLHHRMILDENGARLAKRDNPLTLRALRAAGTTADQVRAMVDIP